MNPAPLFSAIVKHRRVLRAGGRGSDLYTTFVAADETPQADSTPTNLTFTLKDSDDAAIVGASVTYA